MCSVFYHIFLDKETAYMQALGTPQTMREKEAYSLQDTHLPFLLRKAQRRNIHHLPTIVNATQSDGATSGQDGKDDDQEEFDWLTDD
jgi:hypothetical protein